MEAFGQRNQKQSFHCVFGQDSKALGSLQVPSIQDRWGRSFPGKLGPVFTGLSGGAAWVFKASFSANNSLLSSKDLINESRSYCIYSPKRHLCSGCTKNPPNYWKWQKLTVLTLWMVLCVCARLFSHSWLFANPWTVAHQALPSMGFSRQE